MPEIIDATAIEKACKEILDHYAPEPRYILAIMQDMQKRFNYLPPQGLKMLASYTGVPFSQVYAMASFYKAFSLKPKGRYIIKVCDGTACHIKGAETLVEQIYKYLQIRPGETTRDGSFSLETVNCLGACALAPVMVINEKVYGKVTPADIERIIKEYGGWADEGKQC
ncbi:NADH-quinone oxidoreductase subunit E [Thermosyntropha lipolytica DSM 11003]|uniref:NADH-quinone oxidoreductase subunit E n=1 Tax=Thermosyntropha lipolytica DSM 11003 TaxID=1123382 RepID=A0A1M5MNV6_9FIRM|nr:NADH-quinone oxidoreductase subunit NuoE [Thermosyntropha lipolytica]SHG78951.1 NADH-quinone oxidoreductase subunit E [Thermosyntropha lipolytica DSM 11003]